MKASLSGYWTVCSSCDHAQGEAQTASHRDRVQTDVPRFDVLWISCRDRIMGSEGISGFQAERPPILHDDVLKIFWPAGISVFPVEDVVDTCGNVPLFPQTAAQ